MSTESPEMNTEETFTDTDISVPEEIIDEDTTIPVVQQLGITFGILLLIFGTSYADDVLALLEQNKRTPAQNIQNHVAAPAVVTPAEEVSEEVVTEEDPFENIYIEASSAYIWDVQNQRALYNKNADAKKPLASITKLMTAMVAYELIETDMDVHITAQALYQDGDSGLRGGETFSVQDLSDLTLITSSNDGAYALAAAAGKSLFPEGNGEATFVEAMNIRAEEIGLSQTYFKNATGLDLSEREGGAYGSARDVAFLMEYIITHYPGLLEGTRDDFTNIANENGESHAARNTNQHVTNISGIIASKTGYTTLAGGNLVVAFDAGLNRPIIVSVLGSSREGRFRDVLKLVESARTHVSQNN